MAQHLSIPVAKHHFTSYQKLGDSDFKRVSSSLFCFLHTRNHQVHANFMILITSNDYEARPILFLDAKSNTEVVLNEIWKVVL